jgi:16S rRNA (uracil1498-N3)-methyltransferase
MPRFFVKAEAVSEEKESIILTGDDARHIARALRMAVGNTITISNGEGADYICSLEKIRDEECICKIIEKHPSSSEAPYELTLFMGYPKGDKLETVIQKAVELGAAKIVPFISSRCIKCPAKEKEEAKLVRLNRIAEEAAKQSGRGVIPQVCKTLSFAQVLEEARSFDLPIFCYEGKEANSLKEILNDRKEIPKKICAVIGSEGGFSTEEAALAGEFGFVIANLGPRILRCETAPDYVLSALSYHFEL